MEIKSFLETFEEYMLQNGVLNKANQELNGKSVPLLLKFMSAYGIDELYSDDFKWYLRSDGSYKNEHLYTSNFQEKVDKYGSEALKTSTINLLKEKGISLGVVFSGANSLINPLYKNPNMDPFSNLSKVQYYRILSIEDIVEFIKNSEVLNIPYYLREEIISDLRTSLNDDKQFASVFKMLRSKYSDEHKKLFLSHAILDKEVVKLAAIMLAIQGCWVFIDWIDATGFSRDNVSKDTAKMLADAIDMCDSFAYLVTKNYKFSKWMPWELGLSHGRSKNTFVLPLENAIVKGGYLDTEYLQLYPSVGFNRGGGIDIYQDSKLIKNGNLFDFIMDKYL